MTVLLESQNYHVPSCSFKASFRLKKEEVRQFHLEEAYFGVLKAPHIIKDLWHRYFCGHNMQRL